LIKIQTKIVIQENIALAPLTTLNVGGAARFFVSAANETEVVSAIQFAESNDLPLFILGGGSNILIADTGFDGLVLQINLKGIEHQENIVTAQAGEDWDQVVAFCIKKNLAGIECLSGIPGFVGGTPVQNVGAYGQEVAETIKIVRVFDRKSKEILELTNSDCKFSYRTSIFNSTEKNRFVVLAVTYTLVLNGQPQIVYKDLQHHFGEHRPNLLETRQAVLHIRRAKSMVIDEFDPNSKSAGSFFKNPIVAKTALAEIETIAKKLQIENVPSFTFDDNNVKIPAAWLIEKSGFHKGYKFGNVGLSTKHTLALINCGNANAQEILDFKQEIQNKVRLTFKVELKPEPILVGFTD
jgi:UDP-N-acetylmuramate dehydrogenase